MLDVGHEWQKYLSHILMLDLDTFDAILWEQRIKSIVCQEVDLALELAPDVYCSAIAQIKNSSCLLMAKTAVFRILYPGQVMPTLWRDTFDEWEKPLLILLILAPEERLSHIVSSLKIAPENMHDAIFTILALSQEKSSIMRGAIFSVLYPGEPVPRFYETRRDIMKKKIEVGYCQCTELEILRSELQAARQKIASMKSFMVNKPKFIDIDSYGGSIRELNILQAELLQARQDASSAAKDVAKAEQDSQQKKNLLCSEVENTYKNHELIVHKAMHKAHVKWLLMQLTGAEIIPAPQLQRRKIPRFHSELVG